MNQLIDWVIFATLMTALIFAFSDASACETKSNIKDLQTLAAAVAPRPVVVVGVLK